MNSFQQAAAAYAACGAVVIPCGGDDGKRPLIRWDRLRRPASPYTLEKWSAKFGCPNLGLATGPSRLTVVDVDSAESSLVRECYQRFGETPFSVATPRGGRHLYYRSAGEPNRARVDGASVDVRGVGGFIVAPPSQRPGGGSYELISGNIADISRLPPLKLGSLEQPTASRKIQEGGRDNFLWRRAMIEARSCASEGELLSRLEIFNEAECDPPLAQGELESICAWCWKKQSNGLNKIGSGWSWLPVDYETIRRLAPSPDMLAMLLELRRIHLGVNDAFAISPRAMALASSGTFSAWTEKRIRQARDGLVAAGDLIRLDRGGRGKHDPARFAFPDIQAERRERDIV
jgi:hypothetical protein